MKAVLLSIRPWFSQEIGLLHKSIEVRKNKPKLDTPFRCYVYCTKAKTRDTYEVLETHGRDGKIRQCNGKVCMEFTCNKIESFTTDYRRDEAQTERILDAACLSITEAMEYEGNSPCLYGWHISNVVVSDRPKELSEFGLIRPPQSWCYVEELP